MISTRIQTLSANNESTSRKLGITYTTASAAENTSSTSVTMRSMRKYGARRNSGVTPTLRHAAKIITSAARRVVDHSRRRNRTPPAVPERSSSQTSIARYATQTTSTSNVTPTKFSEEVEKLQKTYEKLSKEKDETKERINDDDFKFAKAVKKAAAKASTTDEL